MSSPLITVIVPVYNNDSFLSECIESILNQSYRKLEVIVVDDGSIDSSFSICKKYEKLDSRVKAIRQDNMGVSVARNKALNQASGDFVCFVDSDDFLAEDFVEYMLHLINETDSQIAIVPDVIYYPTVEREYSEEELKTVTWTGEKTACEMLYGKIEIGPWNKLIKREIIEKNNIRFNEELAGGEGYLFSIESFSEATRVAVGHKRVYYYRVDNYKSTMSKFRHNIFHDSLKSVGIMQNKFLGKKKLEKACRYAYWRVYITFLNNLIATGSIKENFNDFNILVHNSRKYAYRSFFAEVPLKRKAKDLLYFVSPSFVARLNVMCNKKRKFNRKGQ